MKNEKGITLISLIIYLIILTVFIAIVANMTRSFYSNVSEFEEGTESAVSVLKFNMYFLNDIKKENASVKEINNDHIKISYKNGEGINVVTQYSIQDHALFKDKIKICDKVENAVFSMQGDNVIKIYFEFIFI